MKSIYLKNFQCFRECKKIPCHQITIFIGENDSGKSAILRALDIFFNNKPMTVDLFHKNSYEVQNECVIQIVFDTLHKDDTNFPKQFIVNDEVTIQKIFSLDESQLIRTEVLIKGFQFNQPELNDIPSLKAPILKELLPIYDLEYNGVSEAQNSLKQLVQDRFDDLPKTEAWIPLKWGDIINSLPIFEYYNSSSIGNPVQLVSTTLKTVYRSYFYNTDEQGREELKPELLQREQMIKRELDARIQTELKEKIQQKNRKILNIYGDYKIDFSSGFQLQSLQADFGQGLRDIDNIGEGTKKRLFLAITEWDKEIRLQKTYKKVIRGYDEPDTSLHPQAQKEIFYILKNLSEQKELHVQPLLCTHSLSMIDRAPPRIINHIIYKDGISHVDYLKGDEDRDIKDFLNSVSSISGISNSSLFFERCFLVVEGETEINALPGLYKKFTGKSILEDGVVIINIEGNGSWKSFLKLLSRNKKNATLLFLDCDIQEDGERSLTPQSMREVGFDECFLNTNVIFAGLKEFEDIFSNEVLSRYLNQHHPKIKPDMWECKDIEALRANGKFSKNIQQMVGKYQHENAIRNRDFKKPEFGIRIAELMTPTEVQNLKEMKLVVEKIGRIVV